MNLKLERAEQHLDEIEKAIVSYINRDPYDIPDEVEREGNWAIVRLRRIRELPNPRWGVYVGEFLHDLRSALDNLVWQLVLLHGMEQPVVQEPVPHLHEGSSQRSAA